ncbi:2-polyprenyl-6-methoxyphenol hydroxylase-like FAD-dependent oxidoreductase [Bradyrhizobium sp. USDA 4449]
MSDRFAFCFPQEISMSGLLGAHAVVIGAGISGLATAKILSSYFDKVTVLERDAFPDRAEPRVGTPHCRQAHVLLKAGLQELLNFYPELEHELELAGAARARVAVDILIETPGIDPWPQRDFGFDTLCMTRPLLEFAVRSSTKKQANISLQAQCRVTKLQLSADQRVTGLIYEVSGAAREVTADLIVDASSRGNMTMETLDACGIPRPEETDIGVDIVYGTGLFRLSQTASRAWRGVIHRPTVASGRGGFVFPCENESWQVTLNGMHGDGPPDDLPGFIAFAKAFRTSTIYDALKGATPLGSIHRFAFPSSRRRRFDTMNAFPHGLLPIGDVVCRFNPAFGQGMTVAAQEVAVLERLLRERVGQPAPLDGLAETFFAAIESVLAAPWSVAESDFMYEKTRGTRPADFVQRMKFSGALQRIATEDAVVHRLLTEVNHLLAPPTVLRDPQIVKKVSARMGAAR